MLCARVGAAVRAGCHRCALALDECCLLFAARDREGIRGLVAGVALMGLFVGVPPGFDGNQVFCGCADGMRLDGQGQSLVFAQDL